MSKIILPAIVQNLIDSLNNKNNDLNTRTNLRDTIKNISDECFRSVKNFDKENGIKTEIVNKK